MVMNFNFYAILGWNSIFNIYFFNCNL